MLFITHRLQAYFLNIRQMASVYNNALLQACLEVAVRAPLYILINSRNFVNNGLFEFLNSHDMPPEHTVFQEPPLPQEKNLVQERWATERAKRCHPKLRTQVTRCTSQHSIATDRMKWCPLLYCSPSRQPRQAIVPAQYSNLKRVSRLRATLYDAHTINTFLDNLKVH